MIENNKQETLTRIIYGIIASIISASLIGIFNASMAEASINDLIFGWTLLLIIALIILICIYISRKQENKLKQLRWLTIRPAEFLLIALLVNFVFWDVAIREATPISGNIWSIWVEIARIIFPMLVITFVCILVSLYLLSSLLSLYISVPFSIWLEQTFPYIWLEQRFPAFSAFSVSRLMDRIILIFADCYTGCFMGCLRAGYIEMPQDYTLPMILSSILTLQDYTLPMVLFSIFILIFLFRTLIEQGLLVILILLVMLLFTTLAQTIRKIVKKQDQA